MSDLVPKTFACIKLIALSRNGETIAVQNADPASMKRRCEVLPISWPSINPKRRNTD
jgi:hypothetical protein